MGSRIGSDLNKRIGASFTPAEFGAAVIPVVAYTHRVSEPLGISVTGWEANMFFLDNTDRDPNNGIIVELIENFLMPDNQVAITAALSGQTPHGNSIFFTARNSDTQYISDHRDYDFPIQLRYGTPYAFYVRPLMAAVLTNTLAISLTLFGFPNTDQNQPMIQLR
jgi:hypothetical protein